MRKQTKIVAALSATALLALGASAVTFAAGWDNSTGTWQYLDNNGSAVTDVWRKSGDYWFYLDSDGNMATDRLVEKDSDFYYVNAEGAMVTNQWVALDSDDYDSTSDDGEAEYRWFYFGSDGKAYRNKKSDTKVSTSELKTINGKKYAFDADGKMLYGWVSADSADVQTDDDTAWQNSQYYFGGWNDGAATTGWVQLTVDTSSVSDDDDTDTFWFYFDSNGKKQANKKKTINGATYYFDEYGRMVDDWAGRETTVSNYTGTVQTSFSDVVYVNGDGSVRKNQWVWAVPTEEYDSTDYEDDDYSWWWTQSSGKLYKNGLKKIKGKYYAFDTIGRMLSGVVYETGDEDEKYTTANSAGVDFTDLTGERFKAEPHGTYYFFGDEATDGSRKSGYQNVEFDDDTYQMYFGTNGKAKTEYNTKIKKFTVNGIVLKADNDTSNYALVPVKSAAEATKLDENYTDVSYAVAGEYDGTDVLVNASGTLQKSVKNLKDNNDLYYFTDADGVVEYVSEEKLTTTEKGNTYVFTYYRDFANKTGATKYYYDAD